MVNPEFQTHVLPNGLRIIHAWMPREVTHCALVVNAGTRDEGEGEAGLAHFIEHVLFKGTQKRKAFHILNRMESVGGEINAYTTKQCPTMDGVLEELRAGHEARLRQAIEPRCCQALQRFSFWLLFDGRLRPSQRRSW